MGLQVGGGAVLCLGFGASPVAVGFQQFDPAGEAVQAAAALGLRRLGVLRLLADAVEGFAPGFGFGLRAVAFPSGLLQRLGRRLDVGLRGFQVGAEMSQRVLHRRSADVRLDLVLPDALGVAAGGLEALLGHAPVGVQAAGGLEVGVQPLRPLGEGVLLVHERFLEGFQVGLVPGKLGGVGVHLVAQRLALGGELALRRFEPVVLPPGKGERPLIPLRHELVVARRPPRLPLQAPHAPLDLVGEVAETSEVGLGRVQLAEGLAAAVLVPGDAGGLLEEPAPVRRVLREDLVDHLQFDHRVGPGAHAGIHEEVGDVLEPARHPAEEVLRLARAVEAAAQRDLGVLGRQHPARVLDRQEHLAETERAPLRRPVEDDVLHLLRAEDPRALLPDHPPHRVDDVRLAAAVRPDDGRHAGVELEHRPLGEAFEAVQFELAEVHGRLEAGLRWGSLTPR